MKDFVEKPLHCGLFEERTYIWEYVTIKWKQKNMKLIVNLRIVCNSGIYSIYFLLVLLNACVDSQCRIGELHLICQQAIVSVIPRMTCSTRGAKKLKPYETTEPATIWNSSVNCCVKHTVVTALQQINSINI
jgi:hypothetical protein